MTEDNILHTLDNSNDEIEKQLKSERKRYLRIIAFLIIVNVISYCLIIKGLGSFMDKLPIALNANLLGFNIIGFLIGMIVAILPYRELPYGKKYLRASLLTILILQSIEAFGLVLLAIMTLAGWY